MASSTFCLIIVTIWFRYGENHVSNFGRWLTDMLKQNQMTRADLAAQLEVTENAVYTWIKGVSKPTDEKLETIVEMFKADRAQVFFLAGKGYAGVEYEKLSPEMAQLAYALQDKLDAIPDPQAREMARQDLISIIGAWTDNIERLADFLESLPPKGN